MFSILLEVQLLTELSDGYFKVQTEKPILRQAENTDCSDIYSYNIVI
jgi:hypothetical protein